MIVTNEKKARKCLIKLDLERNLILSDNKGGFSASNFFSLSDIYHAPPYYNSPTFCMPPFSCLHMAHRVTGDLMNRIIFYQKSLKWPELCIGKCKFFHSFI